MELLVFDTPEDVAEKASSRIAGLISGAEDPFTLGLAGGSTPAATYELLRGRATGWANVTAWLSDERWVPWHHDDCNGRMATEILLDHVECDFERPRWSEYMTAEDSAAFYEARLRSLFADRRPDVIMLGMGEDGHTASLFPETWVLEERDRWFVAGFVPQLGEERLTATYPLLWSAHRLIVLTTGLKKAVALRASFEGSTPAGLLGQGDAEVEWYVDKDAASLVA